MYSFFNFYNTNLNSTTKCSLQLFHHLFLQLWNWLDEMDRSLGVKTRFQGLQVQLKPHNYSLFQTQFNENSVKKPHMKAQIL